MGPLEGLVSGPWWQSIPAWFIAIAAFLTPYIIIRQINEVKKSTNAQITIEVSGELRSEENVSSLHEIYSYKPEDLKGEVDKERVVTIERVVNRLSMLGALVCKDIIDEAMAIDSIAGATVLRCWYQLHAYVKKTRLNRGYFGENFEDFARRSLDYFRSVNGQVFFDVKGKGNIDLIIELQKDELRPRSLGGIRQTRNIAR